MIRIVLSDASYDAISSKLPRDRRDGPCSEIGANA